ncbi:Replication protein A1 [Carabus blaptoides fortunei]
MDDILSAGVLFEIMNGKDVEEPVLLQVLDSIKLDGIVGEQERYRLLISDGQHVISRVIISVKLNDMGTSTPPERFSVIHAKEYFTILVPRAGVIRLMLILMDIQVVFAGDEINEKIGCPTALYDEDVVSKSGDIWLSLAEPEIKSASTGDMASVSLPLIPAQLSKVAIQAPLPVVQAPAETKIQPVRALPSTCVPSTSIFSPSKRLKLSNASTGHTVGLSTPLSPVSAYVKHTISPGTPPCTQITTPAVSLTHSATPTLMVKPSTVQMPGLSCSTEITPIANLRPTARNWIIKARVTVKSPVKPWARGSGCSFTVDLADESGEIKATVFTEWVDKYYGMLQKDHVYYISRGTLKTANKRYNHLNHDYELIVNGATSIVPCDETVRVVEAKYKFVALSEVMGCTPGSVIDVIGVCTSAANLESLMTRGGILPKREVTLVDNNEMLVTCYYAYDWPKNAVPGVQEGPDNQPEDWEPVFVEQCLFT